MESCVNAEQSQSLVNEAQCVTAGEPQRCTTNVTEVVQECLHYLLLYRVHLYYSIMGEWHLECNMYVTLEHYVS